MYIDTKGAFYTYYKGGLPYIQSRLDYELCFESFIDFWATVSSCILLRHYFDHHPLMLTTFIVMPKGTKPFRFHGIWLEHLYFLDLVCATWSNLIWASPIIIVVCKLKALKLALKFQNREIFGNLDCNIKVALAALVDIQNKYDEDSFSEEIFQLEYDPHADTNRLLY